MKRIAFHAANMTGLDACFFWTVSCNLQIPPDCGPTTPDQASSGSRRNENPCQDALSRAVHGQLVISAFWQMNRHGLAVQTTTWNPVSALPGAPPRQPGAVVSGSQPSLLPPLKRHSCPGLEQSTSAAGHGKCSAGAEQPTALLIGPHSVKPVCLVPSCIAVQTGFQSGLAGFALCLALCQNGGGQLSGLFLGFCRFQSWNPIPRRTSMTGSAISPIAISIVFPASPAFPVPDTVRTTSSVLDVSRPARPPSRASSPAAWLSAAEPILVPVLSGHPSCNKAAGGAP